MPVYIAVEVARRELEGRLLLGLVAAERGYDVVLGKIPHHALLNGQLNGWRLPPGILHLKSIAASQQILERFDRLRVAGTAISVQDEEHGLSAQEDYADFARIRFPRDGVWRIDRLMAWGAVDAGWLRSEHPDLAPRIVETGSPRIDLWRTDVIGSAAKPLREEGFVLVASSSSPFNRNPFWVQLYNQRSGAFGVPFTGEPGNREADFYSRRAEMFIYVKNLVRAVRRLAEAHPERTIVLRPHYFEIPEAWEVAVGNIPNVVIRPDGPARAWVRDAAVVVHGGSTIAIEASVAGRPVVAYSPDGFLAGAPANRIGLLASSDEELLGHIDSILAEGREIVRPSNDREFLAQRIAALEGRLASDRIVDEWELMTPPARSQRVERISRRNGPLEFLRHASSRILSTRHGIAMGGESSARRNPTDKGPFPMDVEHKFPTLDVTALRDDARRLSEHLGRFSDVEIIQIGEREVLLRAPGR